MTIAVPVLLLIIGIGLVAGRHSPPWTTAIIFALVGIWLGQTWIGQEIISGFDQLARSIG